jgi:hypothetical protein
MASRLMERFWVVDDRSDAREWRDISRDILCTRRPFFPVVQSIDRSLVNRALPIRASGSTCSYGGAICFSKRWREFVGGATLGEG